MSPHPTQIPGKVVAEGESQRRTKEFLDTAIYYRGSHPGMRGMPHKEVTNGQCKKAELTENEEPIKHFEYIEE